MVQEIGETSAEIVASDERHIQKILDSNKNTSKYWIVIFAKPGKVNVDGKPALIKVIKPYKQRPRPQVGMIVGAVDNDKGTVEWEINMPDRPYDEGKLIAMGAEQCHEQVVETTTIADAYITR